MSKYLDRAIELYRSDGVYTASKRIVKGGARRIKSRLQGPQASNAYRGPDYCYDYKDKKGYLSKNPRRRVFIFGTIPYYDIGGGQRSAQLAKTFDRMGWEVYYIYANKSSDYEDTFIENYTIQHIFIEETSVDFTAEHARKDSIFIFEGPCMSFLPYLELAKKIGAKVIYENIDNWEVEELGGTFYSGNSLKLFLEKSDALTCTARPLVEQTKRKLKDFGIKKPVTYIPNAVDSDLFDAHNPSLPLPDDLVLGSKTFIYYGSLWGSWFDWDTIFELAKNHPRYSFNLIGDAKPIKNIVANAPNNIHFLGLKLQKDLPTYLQYSDVAILPFHVDEIGEYVSPLKIFEYIAMGKRVISTKLPDVTDYPNVDFVESYDDWEKAVTNDTSVDITAAESFTTSNNWYSRVCALLEAIEYPWRNKCQDIYYDNISIAILNYNNKNIITHCIDSLLRCRDRYHYEIVVVDNQSEDGSWELLQEKYGKNKAVKLTRNNRNGCSSGRNLAIKAASKENILFLDSDQWALHKYWIDPYFDVITQVSEPVAVGWAAGWFGSDLNAHHIVDSCSYRYLKPGYLATSTIGYLGSGGLFCKKSLLEKVGGFDEIYDPTCYEDTDLSLAIRYAGGELYYCKYLGVGHHAHQTTKSGTEEWLALTKKNHSAFLAKWRERDLTLITKYIKDKI